MRARWLLLGTCAGRMVSVRKTKARSRRECVGLHQAAGSRRYFSCSQGTSYLATVVTASPSGRVSQRHHISQLPSRVCHACLFALDQAGAKIAQNKELHLCSREASPPLDSPRRAAGRIGSDLPCSLLSTGCRPPDETSGILWKASQYVEPC